MNILLLTNDNVVANYIYNLTKINRKISILTESDYLNKNETNIDIIIFDKYEKEIDIVLEKFKLNPLTPTILLQDYLYNSPATCEECIKNFNRKAVLKPFQIKTLYNTLNNFGLTRCNYYNYYNYYNNTKILPEILEKFEYYTFNKNSNSISLLNKDISDNNHREFIKIIDMLLKYKFKFLIDDQKILISWRYNWNTS